MIKVVTLIKRKASMTKADFHHHWVKIHAPMARQMIMPAVKSYAIAPIVAEHHRDDVPDLDTELDGIAEAWFESREAFDAFLQTEEAKTWLADGATFIGETKTLIVDYESVIPMAGSVS
ncbi:EthD domain-containing protein [Aminobacter sp. MSH1]|uniref:EthD domain-containing protein n=1 Tax=Aminobacter sp. MSH1 TaxID=374606 RepID=UPI000D3B25B2|nr:EthD domain-containing protein [Aminobacter sp. MSH1]